jgi:hypothetical protein
VLDQTIQHPQRVPLPWEGCTRWRCQRRGFAVDAKKESRRCWAAVMGSRVASSS